MSLITELSNQSASAAVNAVASSLSGGTVRLYNGTRPANANTAVTTQVVLALLPLPSPAFTTATNGLCNARTIAPVTAVGTGVATWFRFFRADGTVGFDGEVGASGTTHNLTLNNTSIVSGQSVTITAFILQCNELGS